MAILWILLSGVSSIGFGSSAPRLGPHYWPTPNFAFVEGESGDSVLQPTASGTLESALFGCVRNQGRRFHGGVDLKPVKRDARGEALDEVFAFHRGLTRYVNDVPSRSSFGRYVVVEHPEIGPGVVTLYAHLRRVAVRLGERVEGGQVLGVMGRSAGGYVIPKNRAHLHFELGLWLGSDFQSWFDRQGFETRNWHGAYNGFNIVGLNVWELLLALRSGEVESAREFIERQPVAVVAEGSWQSIPELLRVDPERMTNTTLPDRLAGWRVAFTAEGWPIRWTALSEAEADFDGSHVRVVDRPAAGLYPCSPLVAGEPGNLRPGSRLASLFGRLFND